MSKAKTVDDLDFEIDDDGELSLTGFDDDDEFDFDSAEEVEESDDESEDEEEEEEEEEEESDDEEESSDLTVESLKEEFTTFQKNLPNIVAQSVAMSLAAIGLTGKKKGKDDDDDEEEEEDTEELTSKQLLKRLEKKIETSVEASVNGKMGKYQRAMDEADVTRQFREGATKHGAAYVKAMPQLARIMLEAELKGDDAAERAWNIYRRLNPQQREKLKVNAQKEQKRIAKRRPDADSDDTVTKRPERTPFKKFKGTDSDVFDKSFDSSIVSAIKKRR